MPGRRQGRPRDHMGGGRSRSPGRLSTESGRLRQWRLQRQPRRLLVLPPLPPGRGYPAGQVSGGQVSASTCAPSALPAASQLSPGSAHPRRRGAPRRPCPSCAPSPTPQPRLEDGDPRPSGFPVPGAPPPAPGPRILWSGSTEGAGTGRAGWTGWAPPGCTRRVVHWPAQRSGNQSVRAACADLGA